MTHIVDIMQSICYIISLMAALAVTGSQVYYNAVEGVGFGQPISWIASLMTFIFAFAFSQVFVIVAERLLWLLYRRWEKLNLE